jgi:hypothetical protein
MNRKRYLGLSLLVALLSLPGGLGGDEEPAPAPPVKAEPVPAPPVAAEPVVAEPAPTPLPFRMLAPQGTLLMEQARRVAAEAAAPRPTPEPAEEAAAPTEVRRVIHVETPPVVNLSRMFQFQARPGGSKPVVRQLTPEQRQEVVEAYLQSLLQQRRRGK